MDGGGREGGREGGEGGRDEREEEGGGGREGGREAHTNPPQNIPSTQTMSYITGQSSLTCPYSVCRREWPVLSATQQQR